MNNEYIVEVEGLSKSFGGKPAVIDLSLKIKKGEIFGFLGPNGSGKTTTIRMLCGLMTPDAGRGECLGYDIIEDAQTIKGLVGYVPQTFSLYQDLTVKENLEFVARVYGQVDYVKRVHDTIAEFQLEPYRNILTGRLSGGWKQRLSLASALIHHPKLLLLDEPTAGVDPKARREFWDYITHLTTQGITSLVSTHYMDEAERCNRLGYIVYGHLKTSGTINEIIKKVGLYTWATTGNNLPLLAKDLKEEGIEQVVVWGNELRVSSDHLETLEGLKKNYPQYEWHSVNTNLEAVFIYLVGEKPIADKNNQ